MRQSPDSFGRTVGNLTAPAPMRVTLLLSARSKRLSREVAQRDEWLLQREVRIASLEAATSELEATLREREASVRSHHD